MSGESALLSLFWWNILLPLCVVSAAVVCYFINKRRGQLPAGYTYMWMYRSTRYFLLIYLAGFGLIFFEITRHIFPDIGLFGRIESYCFVLHIYYFLAWMRVSSPVHSPSSNPFLVRPRPLLVLGGLWIADWALPFTPVQDHDTLTWFLGSGQLSFASAGLALFLAEAVHGFHLHTSSDTTRFKYRCLSLGILASASWFYYTSNLGLHLATTLPVWPGVVATCLTARSLTGPIIPFCFGFLLPFDKQLFRSYEQWVVQRQWKYRARQVKWLFERSVALLPAPYRENIAYDRHSPPDLLVEYMIMTLSDIRRSLWIAEAHLRKELLWISTQQMILRVTLREEIDVWVKFLLYPDHAALVRHFIQEKSLALSVPALPVTGSEAETHYYVQLTEGIQQRLLVLQQGGH